MSHKIICFLSVLVFCVPLFCFNVSAIPPADDFLYSDISCTQENISDFKNSNSNYFSYPYIGIYDMSDGSLNSDTVAYFYNTSNVTELLKVFYIALGAAFSGYNNSIPYIPFSNLHYMLYYGTCTTSSSGTLTGALLLFSSSDFGFVDGNLTFTEDVYFALFDSEKFNRSPLTSLSTGKYISGDIDSNIHYNSSYSSTLSPYMYFYRMHGTGNYYYKYQFDSFYSNMNNIGLPDNYEYSSINLKSFEEQIEVKLTPELTYDMQGVDPETKNSNVFKFEITNNSDSSIQWSASIYDSSKVSPNGSYIDSLWQYICEETYYSQRVEENNSFFKDHLTYYGVLNTGSFDEHFLSPGQSFSDIIYWENIKLFSNQSYSFVVSAVKTNLSYPTTLIWQESDSDELRVEAHYDQSYHDSCLNLDFNPAGFRTTIFDTSFSLLSVPVYTPVVRSGNSISNTGNIGDFRDNYEFQSNIDGSEQKINKNYKDPVFLLSSTSRPDVNLSLDNFSIDDVKSYITSCQSFFVLIKDCLMSFPAFIWALICFGITGLIVIGIVKALL